MENVDKLHARAKLEKREESISLSLQASCARATSQLIEPRASDLIIATFDATVAWIERSGRTTRGTRPAYLDWPMLRGDELELQPPMTPKARR